MSVAVQTANAADEQQRQQFDITTVYTASSWGQQVGDALGIKSVIPLEAKRKSHRGKTK